MAMLWWTLRKARSADRSTREDAVKALAAHANNPRAVRALVQALQDEEWEVQYAAREVLEAVRRLPADCESTLTSLLKSKNHHAREYAAEVLGRCRAAPALPGLIESLRDPEVGVRQEAAEALGEIGDAKAADALIAALRDSDEITRLNAARALGKIGHPRAIKPLEAARANEANLGSATVIGIVLKGLATARETEKWDFNSGDAAARGAELAGVFSPRDGSIARIRFKSRPTSSLIKVSGSVSCHECLTQNSFDQIAGPMSGASVTCSKCASRISVAWRTTTTEGVFCVFAAASPETVTPGKDIYPNEILVETIAEG